MQIGTRLAELRKKNKYTQKQLAEALNLSQQVISNIERDATAPDLEFLYGAAELYNISLDELIGRKLNLPAKENYERKIVEVLEMMNEHEKELSLRLVSEVAQYRGRNDD